MRESGKVRYETGDDTNEEIEKLSYTLKLIDPPYLSTPYAYTGENLAYFLEKSMTNLSTNSLINYAITI